jgi:hypothetical protein
MDALICSQGEKAVAASGKLGLIKSDKHIIYL